MATKVTEKMVNTVRLYADERNSTAFTNPELTEVIERYPLFDAAGRSPFLCFEADEFTQAALPAEPDNPDWSPTFDLHAAAADIWDAKAAKAAGNYDFSADGGSFQRSQVAEAYSKQARSHRSRRAVRSIPVLP